MKICPQCRTTYDDETLNFCLEDGTMLTAAESTQPPPATVVIPDPRSSVISEPRDTDQPELTTTPRQDLPSQKGSKAWIGVLGIILGLGVLCGGGFIGLVAIGALTDESDSDDPPPISKKEEPVSKEKGDPNRRLSQEDDFSEWSVKQTEYISSEKRDGALVLTSVDDYYYVVLSRDFRTNNASTLLTVQNIDGEEASSGFGLVIHSRPDAVLENGYAFLIRSDNGTYRIVQHSRKQEKTIVDWRKSSAIKRGSSFNDLEVRADGEQMSFYINGEFIRNVKDYVRYRDGVAGIYTSDEIPIAFSKLEIRK